MGCVSNASDHFPVAIDILISKHKKGSSYWKFNDSLLNDVDFVKMIKESILDIKTQYAAAPYNKDNVVNCPNSEIQLTVNDQLFWETLLVMLRGEIINFASRKKKRATEEELNLNKQIQDIEKNITEDPSTYLENVKKLEALNNDLEILRKQKIDGMIVRSRAKWTELGEKSTKYFCNLENKNFVNKNMQELKTENGKIIVEQKEILKRQRD
jgi:hypothetical protein